MARQPIFDTAEQVFAYELLYREGNENYFNNIDGDQATAAVIINSFFNIGVQKLANGKKCFINFTENLLNKGIPSLFPPESIVVEILENIEPSSELVAIVRELKEKGYTLALDDFVLKTSLDVLIEYVDLIKVDFLSTNKSERAEIFKKYGNRNIKFIAEKVETREMFQEAKDLGYSYFQGYFFSKPTIITTSDIPIYFHNYIQLLSEINEIDPDIAKIAKLIEVDVSLSYKLLKLVNSAAFSLRAKVHSIKQAVMLLGLYELKKWISVLALKDMSQNKPDELMNVCLIRAKMAELIAPKTGYREKQSEFFLMGMFSLIESFLNKPLGQILDEIPISDKVKATLLGKESEYSYAFNLILLLEKGEWEALDDQRVLNDIDVHELFTLYADAVEWVNQLRNNL